MPQDPVRRHRPALELVHSVLESRCVPRAEQASLYETTVIACEADVITVGALAPVSQQGDHGSTITPAIAPEGSWLSTSDLETDNESRRVLPRCRRRTRPRPLRQRQPADSAGARSTWLIWEPVVPTSSKPCICTQSGLSVRVSASAILSGPSASCPGRADLPLVQHLYSVKLSCALVWPRAASALSPRPARWAWAGPLNCNRQRPPGR